MRLKYAKICTIRKFPTIRYSVLHKFMGQPYRALAPLALRNKSQHGTIEPFCSLMPLLYLPGKESLLLLPSVSNKKNESGKKERDLL